MAFRVFAQRTRMVSSSSLSKMNHSIASSSRPSVSLLSQSIKQQSLLGTSSSTAFGSQMTRSFATKTGRAAASDLVKKLDENIKTENEDPIDENATKALLDEGKYTMKKNGNEIELFRTMGTYEITTKFNCLEIEYPSADEEGASNVAAELPVHITVKNTSTGKVARLEATACVANGDDESSVTYNKVMFDDSAPNYSPYLSNLLDDFNEMQIEYFERALGLDGAFASTVVEIAENEEQKLYMDWMANFKKFISN